MSMPDFSDPGAVMGFIVTVAFLTFMGRAGRVGQIGARMGGEQAEPTQQVTVPTPDGGHTSHDVTGLDPAVLAIFQAHAATIESMQTRLANQASDIAGLQKREDRLAKHIVLLKKGVESGVFPPWPDDPQ
jgi:hypothetical protein